MSVSEQAATFQRSFRYRSAVCTVRAHRETLDWLEEFLGACFEPTRDPGECVVELRCEAGAYSRWLATVTQGPHEIECFTLDSARDLWTVARGANGEQWAHDPQREVAICATRAADGERLIRVVASAERRSGRAPLMRCVREFASVEAASRGELPLHASAIETAEGVTLFSGRKRAGKSTLQLYALGQQGVRFVSNDRVFARIEGERAQVRGMPTIVKLREGTIELAPHLETALRTQAWHHAGTVSEGRALQAAGKPTQLPITTPIPGISAAQFCTLLGIEAIAEGTLRRIVFPNIAPAIGTAPGFRLEPIAPELAARRLLADGLLASGRMSPWLASEPEPDLAELGKIARQLTERSDCWSLAMGPSAYATPSMWEALQR